MVLVEDLQDGEGTAKGKTTMNCAEKRSVEEGYYEIC